MFTSLHKLTVEWGDCDPAGIVFYPRFFEMFDAATANMLECASGRSRAALIHDFAALGWPLVDTRAAFHAPVTFDDEVLIKSRVVCVGRSSFEVAHELYKGELHCASASEIRVWSVRVSAGIKSAPIPDEVRDALSVQTVAANES